jgi:phosphonate transport system substrate-binding protein
MGILSLTSGGLGVSALRRVGSGSAAFVAVTSLVLAACERSPFPERRVDLALPGPAQPASAAAAPAAADVLRFSVAAMQSPQETLSSYSQFLDRVGARMGVKVELVQRRTYGEVNDLLVAGHLDAAILCTGGWLDLARDHPGVAEALAVPTVRGDNVYHSYLVVPARSPAASLADLRGKRFAFTDELSLSGRQWVVHELRRRGEDPVSFFNKVEYTRSHDRSIEAVAKGVVDGACVDSLVFDQLAASKSWVREAVRIVATSPPFGIAPVVVSTRLSPQRRAALRDALLGLASDQAAAAALRTVGFDGFALPGPHHYDSALVVVGGQ